MRYKMLRVPLDVWELWFKRKQKIQERVKVTTRKNPKVSLTGVLRYYGNRKIDIWDIELENFFNNKKRIKFDGDII